MHCLQGAQVDVGQLLSGVRPLLQLAGGPLTNSSRLVGALYTEAVELLRRSPSEALSMRGSLENSFGS